MSTTKAPSVKLQKITMADYGDVLKLTSDKDVMKYIGRAITWTPEMVNSYIQQCVTDEFIPLAERQYFSFKIVYGNQFAGIIEFKSNNRNIFFKPEYKQYLKNDVVLTVYLSQEHQGKGLARKSIDLVKRRIRKFKPKAKHLFSIVRKTNPKMIHVMGKLGFKYLYEIKPQGLAENFYVFNIEL
jgi:RimJ/RimL family protein N-acetyltransferase